jgi:hypothetical protein
MARFARRILLATLVAAYGGVTVLGPSLHALPGFNHTQSPLKDRTDGCTNRIVQFASSHDDCPVCHFLAQGQTVVDRDYCGRVEVVQIHPPDEISIIVPPNGRSPSHPRAPPLA